MKNLNFINKKRILITGGAGFIGGNFIRRIFNNSDAIIYNIDKLGYASDIFFKNEFQVESKNNSQRYFFLNIDLSNLEQTKRSIHEADPDFVVHFAAESHVDRSIDNPGIFLQSNVMGTFNLLHALKDHWNNLEYERKSKFRFLHISTDEVFGSLGNQGYFSENTPYSPRSPYSASKASSDHLVNAWYETYGLPILITNCSNNYGPFQFPEKLIPLAILKGFNKESIPLYGDGTNIRDWLFVEDHIDAILLVLSKGKIGECYCVGGHGELNNKYVLNQVCDFLNRFADSSFNHFDLIKNVSDRPGHDFRYSIDSSKIKKELGWKPNYLFKEGLEITVKWYLNNLNWCKKMLDNSSHKASRLGLSGK